MEKEALKRIFEFLEDNQEHRAPFMWKHKNNIPLTKKDLNVKFDLYFQYSEIKSLPEGLKVGGNLLLQYTTMKSLPEGLKVGGDLNLISTKITSLPKDLQVGGYLALGATKITSLPEGLEVHENLYIAYTELEKYTDEELREMIKPGFIIGKIYRRE